jgi:DNA-binding GntR family transcriptional regulator
MEEFSLPSDIRLRRPSAADQIVAALRELILDGSLGPGMPLREVPLANAFDVSRTTIRDAVRALVHEGLVRQQRHRSAFVVDMSPEDAADIYRLRRFLELSAADHVAAMTPEELDRVNRTFERLEKLASTGDWFQVVSADLDFHESIISLHRSPRLLRCFGLSRSELAFCLAVIRLHEHEDQRPDRIIREHDEIRQAVVSGSASEARALLSAHISYYEERVADGLRRRMAKDQQPVPGDGHPGGANAGRTAAESRSRSRA